MLQLLGARRPIRRPFCTRAPGTALAPGAGAGRAGGDRPALRAPVAGGRQLRQRLALRGFAPLHLLVVLAGAGALGWVGASVVTGHRARPDPPIPEAMSVSDPHSLRHVASDSPRIMVVDGSRLVRRLIGDVLRAELDNVEVVECAGLAGAQAALEEAPVDLVTTSLVLPTATACSWRAACARPRASAMCR